MLLDCVRVTNGVQNRSVHAGIGKRNTVELKVEIEINKLKISQATYRIKNLKRQIGKGKYINKDKEVGSDRTCINMLTTGTVSVP